MDEIWERAVETALDGQTDHAAARSLTLDGAVKCAQGRLPPPSFFERLRNLQHLSIANIGVSSLEEFPRLRSLQKLVLSDNRIAGGLEFLVEAGLESLRDLDLSNNRIQYIEDLTPLAQLRLVSLDLYECPVTRVKDYRSRVFGLIESLKYLDKMDAEDNERPESDDEDEEDDDEDEYDPGSGEIDGEDTPYRMSNGQREGVDGIVDVDDDDDEESDADEEETETARRNKGASHQANGFHDAVVTRVDGYEEADDDGDNSGEEIDDEGDGDDEDVVEVHEIDDSEDEDGVEDEDEDDEDDEEEEVDNEEGDYGEPGSTGWLTSTAGEIDGHEQGEDDMYEDDNGEIGEDEQGVDDDGVSEDEEDGEEEDEDNVAGYLVQPVGKSEVHDAGGIDMELGNEEAVEVEDVEDDDEAMVLPSSSSQLKRKRDDHSDEDDAQDDNNEDDAGNSNSSKKHQ